MAERAAGALVVKLARLPGSRESRWAHLLGGAPAEDAGGSASASTAGADVSLGELAALKANVARLEAEVAGLRQLVARICSELGIEAGAESH